ncbi:MAG: 3-deoxy-7-phosphoheptulonate synthase [Clostridiales bacterium]|nr:3-deoxy-7-phosphoheptulonate synthase [Clostridiales bacterium]
MNMEFIGKLPIPKDIKEQYPVSEKGIKVKAARDEEIKKIFSGKDNRLVFVIGPCSADREDAVLEYISRLRMVQEKVKDKILIIPRIYTNKPRTTGAGYKGMLHYPDPNEKPDLIKGVIAIRKLHMKSLEEYGMSTADEMLYPENARYLNDIISYNAVGARSVENQQHRLTASGLNAPVGMKNPTSGDLNVMMNAIQAAQSKHMFIYRGWEVKSHGNLYTHAILRGYVDKFGNSHPNYHYEDLMILNELYNKSGLLNPAVIVDTNHSNSGKKYEEQIRIAKEVMYSCKYNNDIKRLVKGFMIESYLEDGCQSVDGNVYGKSITDPCLGWEKTEKLIYEIADMV